MSVLDLLTEQGLADFATFVRRGRSLRPDGAVRIQTVGDLAVLTVGVLPGEGLLGAGAVTAMRAVAARSTEPLDAVVSFSSVTDRLARAGSGATTFPLPPATVNAGWAGVTPPRSGWEPVGEVPVQELRNVAEQGISRVARQVGDTSGQAAVDAARREVWDEMSGTVSSLRTGLAFAAHVMGFLPPAGNAVLATHGPWVRLSTPRGHVLSR